jgi:tryptophan-rich hypothetical protein
MKPQTKISFKPAKCITNLKKLLISKWTVLNPSNKEKHFMVTKIMIPDDLSQVIEFVTIEAVHSKRSQVQAWQQLNDTTIWRVGWLKKRFLC